MTKVRAALAVARLSVGLDGGGTAGWRLLEKAPALAGADPSVLARAAWAEAGHTDLRLSVAQREQLEIAAAQLERVGYGSLPPGSQAAAAAAILDLAFAAGDGLWRERGESSAPTTVGGLAICVRRLAHRLVAGWRQRRDPSRHQRAAAHAALRRSGGEAPRG